MLSRENLYETIPHNILSLLSKSCPKLLTLDLNIVRLQTNLGCCAHNRSQRHKRMLTTKTIDGCIDDPEKILEDVLIFISNKSPRSHWYRLLDCSDDYPTQELRRLMSEKDFNDKRQLNKLSLQKFAGIDDDLWQWLLLETHVFGERKNCGIQFKKNIWDAFIAKVEIDVEIAKVNALGTSKRWFIRIGNAKDGGAKSVVKQLRDPGLADPPRCPGIDTFGRSINTRIRACGYVQEAEENDNEDGWIRDIDNCESSSADRMVLESTTTTKDSTCDDANQFSTTSSLQSSSISTAPAFPNLEKIGLQDLDPNGDKFQRILGEMIAMQQQHTGEKNKITLIQRQQNTPTDAIMVRKHASDVAFQTYHRKNPYLEDIINALDDDGKVGAQRIADYIAKHHQDQFVAAANQSGVAICGVLNEKEAAAIISEAKLTDAQWNAIIRHFRFKWSAKLAPSLALIKGKLYEGWSRPKVKVINYRADQKEEEKIVATYQDIKVELKKAIDTLIQVNQIASISSIERIRLVVGGDHGQGAFRLGFRVLLDVNGKEALKETKSVATITCKKEVTEILEKTVIDWLSDDLKFINDNPLHLLQNGDTIIPLFEPEVNNPDDINAVKVKVEQFIAGDLAWEAFCLGKLGSAANWCPFCKQSPSEWSKPMDERVCGECWTIDKLNKMAAITLKGPKKLGVKKRPFFQWIPVENYIPPILHLKIGLLNDVVDYFGHLVEWKVIKISPEEREWKDRVNYLNEIIPDKQQNAAIWQVSEEGGKKRKALLQKQKKLTKQKEKLSDEETKELEELEERFDEFTGERDRLVNERSSLRKKIASAAESRRKPKEGVNTWYVDMETIYHNSGVEREDYHKRKFSGGPLTKLSKNAGQIFSQAKLMLRNYKDESLDDVDGEIDMICDEVSALLLSWGKVFKTLYTVNPSTEQISQLEIDIIDAVSKHRELRRKVDDNNDTPKLHVMLDHVPKALRRFPDLVLMMEEWVERFHQTERRDVEAKTKQITNVEKRAEVAAKKRASYSNPDINARCEETTKRRGSYKKARNSS